MDTLTLPQILQIATWSPQLWHAITAISLFGRHTLNYKTQEIIAIAFIVYNKQDNNKNNGEATRLCGLLYSINDKPAVLLPYCKQWYQYGNIHRDNDKSAFESDI